RTDGTMRGFYEELYEKHKVKMKGYVAVQRKILVLIYTLWKKDEMYDPEFEHQSIKNKREKNQGSLKKTALKELA
ncbi:MAG: hypothetical protein ABEH43_10285, partial [Flavobacteriales bacterium]